MGGIISFSDSAEDTWLVAGWAFRQILDDVKRQYMNDSQLVQALERAELYAGLMLERLEPSLAARVEAAITNVVSGILSGVIPSGITEQPYGDTRTVQQYFDAIRDLVRIMQRTKGN